MVREVILSKLKCKYWIIRANTMVRKVVNSCLLCKRIRGKPGSQLMANLPDTRVVGCVPAFTNTGIIIFIIIKTPKRRQRRKRT